HAAPPCTAPPGAADATAAGVGPGPGYGRPSGDRRGDQVAGRPLGPLPQWPPTGRPPVPLVPPVGTDAADDVGWSAAQPGTGPVVDGVGGTAASGSQGTAMRVLPLGTGMALTGLGLAYFGLRLRRHGRHPY
ncbi:hypothetical protein AAHZ94_33645, partial [Streptomyces sp. HSW2009]